MTDRDDRKLRDLFREMRDAEPMAPPYASVARRDEARRAAATVNGAPRPVPAGLRLARIAGFAAMVVVLLVALRHSGPNRRAVGGAPDDDTALQLAASLTHWQAPTDFLLRTPGSEFLGSEPTLGTDALMNSQSQDDEPTEVSK